MNAPMNTMRGTQPMRHRILPLLFCIAAACAPGNALTLEVGDCFDDAGPATDEITNVTDVPIVDCSDLHDNEVYATYELSDDDFPGTDAVYSDADLQCVEQFDAFVGMSYEQSDLDYGWLVPTADSWEIGDRAVVCFLYRVDLAKMTGTMRGSGI